MYHIPRSKALCRNFPFPLSAKTFDLIFNQKYKKKTPFCLVKQVGFSLAR